MCNINNAKDDKCTHEKLKNMPNLQVKYGDNVNCCNEDAFIFKDSCDEVKEYLFSHLASKSNTLLIWTKQNLLTNSSTDFEPTF